MISGHADIDTAVQAVKIGAFDFISKPLDLQRILITIRNAMDKLELNTEIKVLKRKVAQNKVQEIVGGSSAISKVKKEIDKVAPMDARVLITGPNGTGKELVARWVHAKSNRANKPLVEVNCAAIPSELIESELFGHMKGSFTGAVKDHPGKFEQAHGGTIFLDEIGDMSLSAQAKVLRALQEKKIARVGADKEIEVDVRVIAATNKDLLHEIELGNFREDLYYRLAVVLIEVPSLSKRKDDIPSLVEHFIKQICEEYGTAPVKVTKEANKLLQSVAWSGNIRELRNVVERMIIFCNKEIDESLVREYVIPVAADGTGSNKLTVKDLIRKYDNFEDLVSYMEQEFIAVKKALVLK
jgi:DNA-binding NtrC family response regulator